MDIKEQLQRTEIAQGLPDDLLELFLTSTSRVELEEGEVFIRQGEPAAELFVVVAGQVRVFVRGEPGISAEERTVNVLEAGSLMGEAALFADANERTASAAAHAGPATLLALSGQAMSQLSEDHPRLAVGLLKNMLRYTLARMERLGRMYAKTRMTLELLAEI